MISGTLRMLAIAAAASAALFMLTDIASASLVLVNQTSTAPAAPAAQAAHVQQAALQQGVPNRQDAGTAQIATPPQDADAKDTDAQDTDAQDASSPPQPHRMLSRHAQRRDYPLRRLVLRRIRHFGWRFGLR
jgi:hypothetical protein